MCQNLLFVVFFLQRFYDDDDGIRTAFATNFWQRVAKRFKDNPAILGSIFMELFFYVCFIAKYKYFYFFVFVKIDDILTKIKFKKI